MASAAASELAANKFAATRLGLEPESPQLSNAVNIYFAVPPQGGGKECRVSRIIYNKIQSDGRKVRPIFYREAGGTSAFADCTDRLGTENINFF